jgi:hypothetical protein
VLLRIFYSSVLAVILYMLAQDNLPPEQQATKHEAAKAVSIIFSSLGLLFYLGFQMGAMTRDIALRRFHSEKQRQKYYSLKSWRSYIWRLATDKEDKSAASDRDLLVSNLVRSCMDVKTLVVLAGLLIGALHYLWEFSKWIVPGPT